MHSSADTRAGCLRRRSRFSRRVSTTSRSFQAARPSATRSRRPASQRHSSRAICAGSRRSGRCARAAGAAGPFSPGARDSRRRSRETNDVGRPGLRERVADGRPPNVIRLARSAPDRGEAADARERRVAPHPSPGARDSRRARRRATARSDGGAAASAGSRRRDHRTLRHEHARQSAAGRAKTDHHRRHRPRADRDAGQVLLHGARRVGRPAPSSSGSRTKRSTSSIQSSDRRS